jgi:hypothetical protein
MVATVVAAAEAVTAVVGFGPEHRMVEVHCGEVEGDSLAVKTVVEGIDVLWRSVQVIAVKRFKYLEDWVYNISVGPAVVELLEAGNVPRKAELDPGDHMDTVVDCSLTNSVGGHNHG